MAQLVHSSPLAARRARTLLAGEGVPAPRLAAQRRGPRRLRDLRLGAQGRDAEPRAGRAGARQPPEDAPPRRQRRRRGRRLRHPGRHPAQDLGRGGSLRRPQSGARARPRVRRRPRVHRALQRRREGSSTTPARSSAAAASGSSPSAWAWSIRRRWGRPPARRSRTSGRSPGWSPTPKRRDRIIFDLMIELEAELGFHVASFSAVDLRLQGDGRAERARRVLPRPPRRALRDDRLLRPQPLLDQHLAVVQARAAVHGPRPQRRDQHDRAAPPGGRACSASDPARLLGLPGPEPGDRHTWSAVERLSLAEAMEMVVPPIVDEIRRCPPSCSPSTCTCARRWARSPRARWR